MRVGIHFNLPVCTVLTLCTIVYLCVNSCIVCFLFVFCGLWSCFSVLPRHVSYVISML